MHDFLFGKIERRKEWKRDRQREKEREREREREREKARERAVVIVKTHLFYFINLYKITVLDNVLNLIDEFRKRN